MNSIADGEMLHCQNLTDVGIVSSELAMNRLRMVPMSILENLKLRAVIGGGVSLSSSVLAFFFFFNFFFGLGFFFFFLASSSYSSFYLTISSCFRISFQTVNIFNVSKKCKNGLRKRFRAILSLFEPNILNSYIHGVVPSFSQADLSIYSFLNKS